MIRLGDWVILALLILDVLKKYHRGRRLEFEDVEPVKCWRSLFRQMKGLTAAGSTGGSPHGQGLTFDSCSSGQKYRQAI